MNIVRRNLLGAVQPGERSFGAGDIIIVVGLMALLYAGVRLASPTPVVGPEIDLSPAALPWYAFMSLMRMTASYLVSLAFAFSFGYVAARSHTAERVMLPILDVLQSVPLLSFLPVVLLVLTTIIPGRLGVEASAVILIFTSQAWNIAYSFHQSVRTAPRELQEASAIFHWNWWYRLRHLELPFGIPGLLWNSIVSWANGWFFLMAAETFRVGERDFRLPGLGSYLQRAADQGNGEAILLGFITLVLLVVLLDQLVWRPLLVWAEKFRADLTENDSPPTSWFYDLVAHSRLAEILMGITLTPLIGLLDRRLGKPARQVNKTNGTHRVQAGIRIVVLLIVIGLIGYGAVQCAEMLAGLSREAWGQILVATLASTGRVVAAMVIGLLWTVPVGVWIGTNPRLSGILQPIIQSIAAVPATALFPVLVLFFVSLPFGLDIAAILLMLLGTQWYLLFNVIAGVTALPQELKDAARLFRVDGWSRWRTLILPALFPYIITGMNVAGGGAWNASIVAEYTQYNNHVYTVSGLGAIISQSTASGNFAMLLAATLTMIITVVGVNQFLWQRLHHISEEKYRAY